MKQKAKAKKTTTKNVKVFKFLNNEKINTAAEAIPEGELAQATPEEVVATLGLIKGFLITVLEFAKFFTSAATDVKIDRVIALLKALPVTPAPEPAPVPTE